MQNKIALNCHRCGALNDLTVSDCADEFDDCPCHSCGVSLATMGQLRAKIAQQAAGIGSSELADDHVPLGGPPFGSTT